MMCLTQPVFALLFLLQLVQEFQDTCFNLTSDLILLTVIQEKT